MVKYLSTFLSNLFELCQPLRKLTHKDAEWQWTQEQKHTFKSLKVAVTQAPVLKYFSPQAQTEGQGDASQRANQLQMQAALSPQKNRDTIRLRKNF